MPANRAGARRQKTGHLLRCTCAARPPCSAGSYFSTADGNDWIFESIAQHSGSKASALGYTLQMPISSYAVHRRSYAKNWDAFFSPSRASGLVRRPPNCPAASHTKKTRVAPQEGELAFRTHALRCAAPGGLVLRGSG